MIQSLIQARRKFALLCVLLAALSICTPLHAQLDYDTYDIFQNGMNVGVIYVPVRGADPSDWYALTELSDAAPIVGDGERVRLSPSHVETFTRCGLRWLLESAVGAGHTDVLRHLGTVIHAAAQLIASGATEQQVAGRIDDIWHHLDFGSVWYGNRQRELAERMVRKFLDWHTANPRELLAA